MATFKYFVVLACLLHASVQRSTPQSDSYVAAVLEYQPLGPTSANLENYLKYIEEAATKDADIVVFPELTLNRESIEVPMAYRLKQYPVPALEPDLYHHVLVAISNAARQHQIYVVINIEEIMNCTNAPLEYCPEEKTYLFNTNVVFDRSGAVIDRYRKINLFGERSRTPALLPELGVFKTDFGVSFGHYICFDLQFQVPAFQVVEQRKVTDVIFTTMWFSELPYLTAVQIQEAYAFSQNINFLGSGANNVRVGSAGSGIYSGKAGALASTMPGLPVNRLLVATVPKVPGQVTGSTRPGPIYDPPTDHDTLKLKTDPSITAHVTRPLIPGAQEFTLTDREVTCVFRINLSENQPAEGVTAYQYRASAFAGVRTYDGITTGGTRLCSVFACTGNTIDTCGKRFPKYNPKTTGIFNELSIIATVPTPALQPSVQTRDSGYFPVSLTPSIMPLEAEYFSYSEDTRGDITVYTMSLNNKDAELYTFAVWGRYFPTDKQTQDPPRMDHPVAGDLLDDSGDSDSDQNGTPGSEQDASPDAAATQQISGLLIAAVFLSVSLVNAL